MTWPLSAQAVEAAAREMHDIALLLEEDPPTQEWHEMSPARQQGMLARAERVLRAALAAAQPERAREVERRTSEEIAEHLSHLLMMQRRYQPAMGGPSMSDQRDARSIVQHLQKLGVLIVRELEPRP